mgnify:CR=1 FL=1
MTFEEFQNKYNIKLNRQQADAVQSVEGPVLLLAVPGSGKTTVLVTRLGYMIYCKGIAPENILTLTYTVAATRDMAERFEKYFGAELRERLEFRTINGVCARIIQYFGQLIGKDSFQLVTEETTTAGMLSLIFQQAEGTYPTEGDIKDIRSRITYIKNMMLSAEQISELEEEADFQLSKIYKMYCEEMRNQGLMDYDDQMIYALNILRRSPETLQYFQSRYQYICVDEAQDTSKIQHEIISLLAGGRENLFMVGDEDQSIYGFRAAYPKAMLSFEKNHPGAKVLLMEENFRSNARIVEAADRFIQKNTMRHEKHMKAFREAGANIREIELKTRKAQYTYLEKVAMECREQTAVLYRDNESVLPLVDRLERQGIPYRMRNADLTFFTHRTVTDILNIIRFAMNPKDTELFMQIYFKLNLYINKQNAIRFCEISTEKDMPVLEAAVRYGDFPDYTVRSIQEIRMHLELVQKEAADKAVNRIVKLMGYGEYLERMGLNDGKIFIMKEIACMEETAEGFLNRVAQLQQIIREKEYDSACPFILSTIHASKGLEYDTVYLLDVMDGILPEKVLMNQKKADAKEWETYEEERRLFYVGVTRAKNCLQLFRLPNTSTFCKELLGRESKVTFAPGQGRYLAPITVKGAEKPQKVFSEKEFAVFCESLSEGDSVAHKKYGHGVVAEISEEYVTIQFEEASKKFLLRVLFESGMLSVE